MSRDYDLYIDDMREAARKVIEWTSGIDRESFVADAKTYDAVIRNLLVLGEAAKHVPDDVRLANPAIPWVQITGMRDLLIHGYFGIDEDILWDAITTGVPELASHLARIELA
jgi:uncharacterized protein with HEPN domain